MDGVSTAGDYRATKDKGQDLYGMTPADSTRSNGSIKKTR